MPNSNEKLVAGIVALIPVAIDAFKDDHLDRQVDAIMTNTKVRDIGSRMAGQTEKYLHNMIKSNNFTRQVAAQFKPRQSPAPAILADLPSSWQGDLSLPILIGAESQSPMKRGRLQTQSLLPPKGKSARPPEGDLAVCGLKQLRPSKRP